MRIVAFITDPIPVRAILAHLGQPIRPPVIAPARGPPLWHMPETGRDGFDSQPSSNRSTNSINGSLGKGGDDNPSAPLGAARAPASKPAMPDPPCRPYPSMSTIGASLNRLDTRSAVTHQHPGPETPSEPALNFLSVDCGALSDASSILATSFSPPHQ